MIIFYKLKFKRFKLSKFDLFAYFLILLKYIFCVLFIKIFIIYQIFKNNKK